MTDAEYLERRLDRVLTDLVGQVPAILVTGTRATGKTTSAGRIVASSLRLDEPRQRLVVDADPDAAVAGLPRPTLIDEWQLAPEILGAVKRHVDGRPGPGQFVITGSSGDDLQSATWPGTGRLIRIPMYGLTSSERRGGVQNATFLDRLVDATPAALASPREPMDLRGYVDELLVGGFPEPALTMTPDVRRRWLESYLDQVVTRDLAGIGTRRDPQRLRRYLDAVSLNTAGVVDDVTLLTAAGVERSTGLAYDRLLAGLDVIESLPAWWSNRLKRLVQRPKRYVTDAALAAAAMGLDDASLLADGDALGRLLDTFVASQLRAEAESSRNRYRLFHVRTQQGRHEVDLLAELPGQRIVGIEIKATSTPKRADAKHLEWLRTELGPAFVAGVLFHTGPRVLPIDGNITAVPIACLWDDGS